MSWTAHFREDPDWDLQPFWSPERDNRGREQAGRRNELQRPVEAGRDEQ